MPARKTCACGEGAPAGAWPQLGTKLTCQQRSVTMRSATCAPRPHVAFLADASQPRTPFPDMVLRRYRDQCASADAQRGQPPHTTCITIKPHLHAWRETQIRTSITRSGMAASRTSLGSATPSTVPPIQSGAGTGYITSIESSAMHHAAFVSMLSQHCRSVLDVTMASSHPCLCPIYITLSCRQSVICGRAIWPLGGGATQRQAPC